MAEVVFKTLKGLRIVDKDIIRRRGCDTLMYPV